MKHECREPEIGHEIRSIQRMIHHRVEKTRTDSGSTLTFVQTRTLTFLLMNQNRDMYQKDVEKELNIRRSTATEILNVLERDGYVQRQMAESDRRLKKLIVTDKAKDLGMRMFEDMQRLEKLLKQNISEADLAIFFRVAAQIKQNLKEDCSND